VSLAGNTPNFEDVASLLEKWEPEWKRLENMSKKVLMWDYKGEESIAVVYRFVIAKDNEKFTIYVGSGKKLGPKSEAGSLVYQYNYGNRKKEKRPELEKEINKFKEGYEAWTEIIRLDEKLVEKILLIENLLICKYWIQYIKKSETKSDLPQFLNKR
jgi:hypothetical protein